MWKQDLNEVIYEIHSYDEKENAGATSDEILLFSETVQKEFHVAPPEEYIDVLKVINGLEYNGFILYGIDEFLLSDAPQQHIVGCINENKDWRGNNEDFHKYLFLGDSSNAWYVFKIKSKAFHELDKPSGSIMETYSSFYDLFADFLKRAL